MERIALVVVLLATPARAQEDPAAVPTTAPPAAAFAVDEALIAALRDRDVVVRRLDGSEIRGTFLGGTAERVFVVIDDGRMLEIDTREVARIAPQRAAPPPISPMTAPSAPAPPPAVNEEREARVRAASDLDAQAGKMQDNSGTMFLGSAIGTGVGVLMCAGACTIVALGGAAGALFVPAAALALGGVAGVGMGVVMAFVSWGQRGEADRLRAEAGRMRY